MYYLSPGSKNPEVYEGGRSAEDIVTFLKAKASL